MVHKELIKKGWECSVNRVAQLMRRAGLKSKTGKKFKVTTDSEHNYPVADNLLNRNFSVDEPNKAWVGDITYMQNTQTQGSLLLLGFASIFAECSIDCDKNSPITQEFYAMVQNKFQYAISGLTF
jgi:putative transposase